MCSVAAHLLHEPADGCVGRVATSSFSMLRASPMQCSTKYDSSGRFGPAPAAGLFGLRLTTTCATFSRRPARRSVGRGGGGGGESRGSLCEGESVAVADYQVMADEEEVEGAHGGAAGRPVRIAGAAQACVPKLGRLGPGQEPGWSRSRQREARVVAAPVAVGF